MDARKLIEITPTETLVRVVEILTKGHADLQLAMKIAMDFKPSGNSVGSFRTTLVKPDSGSVSDLQFMAGHGDEFTPPKSS